MQDLKPQRVVEPNSSWHFVGAQCDRADPSIIAELSCFISRAIHSRRLSTGQNKAECATYRLTAT